MGFELLSPESSVLPTERWTTDCCFNFVNGFCLYLFNGVLKGNKTLNHLLSFSYLLKMLWIVCIFAYLGNCWLRMHITTWVDAFNEGQCSKQNKTGPSKNAFLLLSPLAKWLHHDIHAVHFRGRERGLPVGWECPICDWKRKYVRGEKEHRP